MTSPIHTTITSFDEPMKLYATSRSERAQKGQGGNQFIETVHTVEHDNGEREEVARTTVTREGDEYTVRQLTATGDDTTHRVPIRRVTAKKKGDCPRCNGYNLAILENASVKCLDCNFTED